MIGNMAETATGLWWNGGQGLHVGLAGMFVTNLLSFPKVILLIFFVFILIAVSNASSSSLHLKHGALRNRYVSLGIERQFFKMKNAWSCSICSRFSVMLSSTLVFAFKCSGADSWCRGGP